MCIGCHWGQYRHLFAPAAGGGLTRRRALQGGALLAASVAAPALAQDGSADLVFRNGAVYTVDPARPWARAVAVKGKRIVRVGDDADVAPLTGRGTRVVDLEGRMLLPGFVEGHIHPMPGATLSRGVDAQADTRDDILALLRAYRDKAGPQSVVRGFGWRYGAFPATGQRKEDLDAIWPDVPVILIAIDGHSGWVNSKALAIAGATKNTPDPLPGFSYFQRDPASGEPTGYLVEVPAMILVNNAVEPFRTEYVEQSLREWLPAATRAGITAVFDAGMMLVPESEGFGIYTRLEQEGKLPFRVVGSYYHNNPAVDPLPIIQGLRQSFHSELVRASVLKLNIDGGDAQRTAALLAPYADAPDTSGDTLLPPALFTDIIRRADLAGIDVHIHSCGDRATRLSLDALESAIRTNPPRDRRNAIAHLYLTDPADIPRFGKLGVGAQFSSQWPVPDLFWQQITSGRVGPERAGRLYSIGSILSQGGVLSFGTDWPAANHYSTFRPLDAIQIAMTRREHTRPDGPQLAPAHDTISLEAALRAATMGPAWQIGLDREIGSIEAGKLADLVVLERNLFELAPSEIHRTRVAMTVMNGEVRHG